MGEIKQEHLKTLRSKVHTNILRGEGFTHSFKADYTDIDPRFVGKFTVKYPNQLERLQMGVTKAALLGNLDSVDDHTNALALILSTLDVVLIEKPEWFNVDDPTVEYEIMEAVFLEYLNWMSTFRKRSEGSQPNQGSEDSGSSVPLLDNGEVAGPTD